MDPGARRRAGPRAALRHPPAHDHPRQLRRRLGRAERLLGASTTARSPRSRRARADGIRGPAADARAARRLADGLEVSPNLWAGVGLGRGGAGTALVGSHEEVAERIEEYPEVGIDEFVLSGYPHLEELYWFGEGVLPLLERRGLWRPPRARERLAGGREGIAVPFAVGAQR